MLIGIDIDDTLNNCTEAMVEYVNERLKLDLTLEDFKTYRMEDYIPDPYKWIIENGFHDKLFWKKVKISQDAATFIKKLWEDGHELYFVTASLPENLRKKLKHLTRSLEMPVDYMDNHLINIRRKQLLNLDILVDDCLSNLIGGSYYGICLSYPWNAPHKNKFKLSYAENWEKVYEIINETGC